ncbi:MAG: carbohydrate kinase [Rhodobacteraceae bacterium]|nr:carbohydrate kinase [Paracoccaceae bacterium]
MPSPEHQGSSLTTPKTQLPEALCIGAIHWDTIAHAEQKVLRETSTPSKLKQKAGGVATNVARALARLDVSVTLLGATGNDPAAKAIEDQLQAESIKTCFSKRSSFATGQYLALHDPDGGLAAACVDDAVLRTAPFSTFDGLADKAPGAKLWFVDANLTEEHLEHVGAQARDAKVRLIADGVSRAKVARLKRILKDIHLLVLNYDEAEALVGSFENTVSNRHPHGPRELLEALGTLGANSILITNGSKPVHGRQKFANGETILFERTPPSANIVDVTGAGDSLIAGTIASMLHQGLSAQSDKDLKAQLSYGLEAARLTLETTGAVSESLSFKLLFG